MATTARMSWCRVPLLMLAVGAALGESRASADAMYSISAVGDPLANSANPSQLSIDSEGNTEPGVNPASLSAGGYTAWTGDVSLPGASGGYPLAMANGPGIGTISIPLPYNQPDSYVLGVSSSGLVLVGYLYNSPATELYDLNSGQVTTTLLALLGPKLSQQSNQDVEFYGINSSSQLVGYFTSNTPDPSKVFSHFDDGNDLDHALLTMPGGPAIDLNDVIPASSGWTLLMATGINNQGQIVGYGINPSGTLQVYELTPSTVPEPSTLAIFAIVGCACGFHVMGRRRVHGT